MLDFIKNGSVAGRYVDERPEPWSGCEYQKKRMDLSE